MTPRIHNFFSLVPKYKLLLGSFIFLSLYSGALYTFATTYVSPGTILDPLGIPGSYTVTPPLTYGGAVTSGHDGEGLYINSSGELVSDDEFTRDESTHQTIIKQTQGSDYSQFLLADSIGPFSVPGIGIMREDTGGTVGSGFLGIIDASGLGASPYTIYGSVDNVATNTRASLVLLPQYTSIGTQNNTTGVLGTVELSPGNALIGADNIDGGGDDAVNFGVNLNGGNGAQLLALTYLDSTNGYVLNLSSSGITFDFDSGSNTTGLFYTFPVTDGSSGQVLTTDGLGALTWETLSTAAALPNKFIGVGDGSGELNGYSEFTYNESSYLFNQQFPNNINNGTALGSPLAFGAASFTGSGLDDITLNWSVSNYQSNKYGGNLTIQIATTGTPDTFNWFYTGGYSQTIGTATNVPITGAAQQLIDTDGNVIAEITFGATTGHTFGDSWSAGTSLSSYDWGAYISDSDGHIFSLTKPVYGVYELGDTNRGDTSLRGNQTRLQINDNIGEAGIYASRYFRIEAPGGDTAVLADMQNSDWRQYADIYRIFDTAGTHRFFEVNISSGSVSIGDIDSVNAGTQISLSSATDTILINTSNQLNIRGNSGADYFFNAAYNSGEPIISFGDTGGFGNSTAFALNDQNQNFIITSPNSTGAILSITNQDGTCTLDPGDVSGLACPSDQNLKKGITTLDTALNDILSLRPVTYRLISEDDTASISTGLIAQEVQPLFPTLVKTQADGTLSLNYGGFTPFIIKAIQELDLKIKPFEDLLTENNSVANILRNFLASAVNGIEQIITRKIKTEELCIEDVCVTRDQFLRMVEQGGSGTSGSIISGSGSTTSGDTGTTGDVAGSTTSGDTGNSDSGTTTSGDASGSGDTGGDSSTTGGDSGTTSGESTTGGSETI